MRYLNYLIAALVALSLQSPLAIAHDKHADKTVVKTKQGEVEGVMVEGFDVISWKGLPYAKPPLGELRWKAPQSPDSWEDTRSASDYGSRCFQPQGWGGYRGSEDCLYLNVWRPTGDRKKGKAIKVNCRSSFTSTAVVTPVVQARPPGIRSRIVTTRSWYRSIIASARLAGFPIRR